jgi:hypothetical protein
MSTNKSNSLTIGNYGSSADPSAPGANVRSLIESALPPAPDWASKS